MRNMNTELFIENVSKSDIINGWHLDPTQRSTILIQISDWNEEFATPKYYTKFFDVFKFKFDDTEDVFDVNCITDSQAKQIAVILKFAYKERKNIVVHCHAGICRSGAVVEVGEMLGFAKCERARIPNVLVKRKIMQALGIGITSETSAFNKE